MTKKQVFVVLCAWCGRMRTQQGQWEETPPLDLRKQNSTCTHGICPHCKQLYLTVKEHDCDE